MERVTLLERFSKVFFCGGHAVPAKVGRSAFSDWKRLVGDTLVSQRRHPRKPARYEERIFRCFILLTSDLPW